MESGLISLRRRRTAKGRSAPAVGIAAWLAALTRLQCRQPPLHVPSLSSGFDLRGILGWLPRSADGVSRKHVGRNAQ